MPPTRPGPADGRHPPPPPGSSASPQPSLSSDPSSSKRRQRVNSNGLLSSPVSAPSAKRSRLNVEERLEPAAAAAAAAAVGAGGGGGLNGSGIFASNDNMSAKVQGKQPEVVDLTGSSPSAASWGGAGGRGLASAAASAFQPQSGARKLVIKNLRVAPNRSDEVANYYKRTWAELEAALASILAGEVPRLPLERLYRGVEDLCLHDEAALLYRNLKATCEAHLFGPVLDRIRADTKGVSDIEVLRIVYREWLVWGKKSTIVRSTYSYLDRSYLINERKLMQIDDMLIGRFRRAIFQGPYRDKNTSKPPLIAEDGPGQRLLDGMFELVEQDRRGDPAFDGHLLRETVRMLHVFNVYIAYFEPQFLKESEAYFSEFARDREATAGLQQYIQACEALLQREALRCNAFNLDSTTKKELISIGERVLIADREAKLLNEDSVGKLLDAGDVVSARALYELLRLPRLQKRLRRPWEAYIQKTGGAIVTDVARGDEMVVRLLLLRRSLDVMIRDAFARDDDFTYGMREAFGRFINDRRVAAVWASGASKVGEMIAKYIDMLLRGGLKTLPPELLSDSKDRAGAERSGQASTGDEDAELDRQLDQGLDLFRFIQGKDVFEAFYKKDLARRLLMGRSASQDAERNMLSKLKTECGSSLTHNLEQMFRDQELSRDEMAAYKQWLDSTGRRSRGEGAGARGKTADGGVDLQVSVLSSAAWPTYPDVALNLPPEVLTQVNLFDSYYKSKHTGRQLTWAHVLGNCVVKARFNRGVKELMVSSFQATVLLLFNQAEAETASGNDAVLSYAQIAAATGLQGGDLDRTLQSLACGKVRVLTKHPKGRDVGKMDTFTVNKALTDPKFRIKINQIQLRETKEENKATYERVAADRQFETQAAIVRIMKSRKSLGHAQLVAEVISQTKSRGALDPAEIKQNIEKLIEKDYLDREDGKYIYLA